MPKHIIEPEKWIDRYSDYLFNYTISRVSDREMAKDLVQDTFVASLKSMKNFKGDASERTWLISILKRKIIDTYRKKYSSGEAAFGKHGETIFDGDFYSSEEPFKGHWLEGKGPNSYTLLPEGQMEQEELMKFIRLCIENLQPRQASAFIMRMIDEEDTDTICKELGISTSNLWVMLHRARLKMRACLEKHWMK